MATFVLAYRSPKGYTPGSPETIAAWTAWFEGMGANLVDTGKPVVDRATLGNCDAAASELGGFSLISAPDLKAAVALAEGCPHLGHGGGVEIGELGEVPAPETAANAERSV
jgi:hypothetical protein